MLGLALAALYVAFTVFVSGTAVTVAVASALVFLWWWTVFWLVIILVLISSAGAGIGGSAGADSGNTFITALFGAAGGFLGLLVGGLLTIIPASLSLSGVYIMYHSVNGHADFDTVPMSSFIIGAVLYSISILMSIANRSSSRKN